MSEEKKFVDCDGNFGESRVVIKVIDTKAGNVRALSGKAKVVHMVNGKAITSVRVQLFAFTVKPDLYQHLREDCRSDADYDNMYTSGNPITMPGLVVESNAVNSKMFWTDLSRLLKMLAIR